MGLIARVQFQNFQKSRGWFIPKNCLNQTCDYWLIAPNQTCIEVILIIKKKTNIGFINTLIPQIFTSRQEKAFLQQYFIMSSVFAKKIRFYLEEKHVLVKLTLISWKFGIAFKRQLVFILKNLLQLQDFCFRWREDCLPL